METQITEVNRIIDTYLNFEFLSAIDEGQYKETVIEFFKNIDQLKARGLDKNDEFIRFINEIYYDRSEKFEEHPVYEERIQTVFSEITEYCSPPYFWTTPLEVYLKKQMGIIGK